MGTRDPHQVSFDEGKWLVAAADASEEYLGNLAQKNAKITRVDFDDVAFLEICVPTVAPVESPAKRANLASGFRSIKTKGLRSSAASLKSSSGSHLQQRLTPAQLADKKQIDSEIKDLTEKIRRQRLVQKIRNEDEFDKLELLIEKWTAACNQAMDELKMHMPDVKFSTFFRQQEVDPNKYGIELSSENDADSDKSLE